MCCFGLGYCKDQELVVSMEREALVKSLVSFYKINSQMVFTEDFLKEYPTWKVRHILFDAIKETFYPNDDEEIMRMLCENEQNSKNSCSEQEGS